MTQPLSQTIQLEFYLDIPGDGIIMYNSASIEPPEPQIPALVTSGMLLATLFLALFGVSMLRRRRGSA